MSLGRLLAMGGTVDRTGDTPRYKMLDNAVPVFGTKQRSRKTLDETEKKPMSTPSLFDQPLRANAAAEAKTAPETNEMQILTVGVFPPKLNHLPPVQTWWMRFKEFFRWERKKGVAPRPIQTEWPLDRIVVVRNDLSDSDYEVVWSDGCNASPVKEGRPKGEQLVGRAWRKVNPFTKAEPKAAEPVEASV